MFTVGPHERLHSMFILSPTSMKKLDAIRLRKQVQSLAQRKLSASTIARRLGVSRPFVHRWKDADDPTVDQRGWAKGKKRKYTDAQETNVLAARDEAEQGFFSAHRRFRKRSVMRSH